MTLAALQEAYEAAELEVEAAVFVHDSNALDVQLLEQAAAAAFARWQAVLSQQPDRQPFAGRAR
jgi:hypothetical protein